MTRKTIALILTFAETHAVNNTRHFFITTEPVRDVKAAVKCNKDYHS